MPGPAAAAGGGPAALAALPAALPAAQLHATVSLSPGLAQLLNAALIDGAFCAAFLESPLGAMRRALAEPGQMFGTTLPDAALRLPPLALSAADLRLLRDLPRLDSFAAAARQLRLATALSRT